VGVVRDHGRAAFWDLGAMRSPENASRTSILWRESGQRAVLRCFLVGFFSVGKFHSP
jgi:hypothetical protein